MDLGVLPPSSRRPVTTRHDSRSRRRLESAMSEGQRSTVQSMIRGFGPLRTNAVSLRAGSGLWLVAGAGRPQPRTSATCVASAEWIRLTSTDRLWLQRVPCRFRAPSRPRRTAPTACGGSKSHYPRITKSGSRSRPRLRRRCCSGSPEGHVARGGEGLAHGRSGSTVAEGIQRQLATSVRRGGRL